MGNWPKGLEVAADELVISKQYPSAFFGTSLASTLTAMGIDTLIHYPVPLHAQRAFAPANPASCPVAAAACEELVSLPLHPGLPDAQVDRILAAVIAATRGPLERSPLEPKETGHP